MAVLVIPGPHRLNWTVDTVLTARGTWLMIIGDGGRYDPLPVKRISESVSEFHLYLQVINCDHAVSLKHLHSGDKGERTEMNGRNHIRTQGRTDGQPKNICLYHLWPAQSNAVYIIVVAAEFSIGCTSCRLVEIQAMPPTRSLTGCISGSSLSTLGFVSRLTSTSAGLVYT